MSSEDLIRSVLGDDYLPISFSHVSVDVFEDQREDFCEVAVDLVPAGRIIGSGAGTIDALFAAFKSHYAQEYQSLHSITLADFKVKLLGKTDKGQIPGAEARCQVTLILKNSWGKKFDFVSRSRSLMASAVRSVAQGVEHFVNSERAYLSLYRALADAKKRNRQDLVDKYTLQLAEVVKSASYTDTLEKIKEEVLK